jgi:hypothetical protein
VRQLVWLGLLLPSTALAAPKLQVGENFLGGRIVSRAQVFATAGYPDLTFGARFRLPASFELSPVVRFEYPVAGFGEVPTPLGATAGVELRWQVVGKGIFAAAVTAAMPVHVGFGLGAPTVAGFGLLHPGFLATVSVQKLFDLDFGFRFEDDLWFGVRDVAFVGAVPFLFGAELEVLEGLSVGARVEAGPAFGGDVGGWGPAGYVGARVRGFAGVAWRI